MQAWPSCGPRPSTYKVTGAFTVGQNPFRSRDQSGLLILDVQANAAWMGYDSIITRDQSTVNDLARGAATIGAFVCLLSPDSCKPTPK